ncbi:uncharacterized protein ARMOST_05944 [Armillaria ostoyae]|uniref:Thioesterase domain-containing protein n=1 Tax=Armillaria ostoyae TaxID=47428 RepID=A0A284R1L6_ARMOS|nr:uncharacterized protein ARMOST_05944 [Armillaria ostoyae]
MLFTSSSALLPSDDYSSIEGNVPLAQKQRCAEIFAHFIGQPATSFGAAIGRNLRLAVVNVYGLTDSTGRKEAETVCEIEVTRDMCNVYGTLHGGCAAYLIDPCSVSALVALGVATGTDGTGVSQSMNLIWHRPAVQGRQLRIVSNTISMDGRLRSSRSEIQDSHSGVVYVSAVHTTMPLNTKPPNASKGKL